MIQPVGVCPTVSPETDTLYKVLKGPVTLDQSGAKEMRESEQSGDYSVPSRVCMSEIMWRLNHIIGHTERILVKR